MDIKNMDNYDLLAAFSNAMESSSLDDPNPGGEYFGEILSRMRMNGEWVSVETPPENTHVVIILEEAWGMSMGYFHEGAWRLAHDTSRIFCRPTHWMPLPQPPKEG